MTTPEEDLDGAAPAEPGDVADEPGDEAYGDEVDDEPARRVADRAGRLIRLALVGLVLVVVAGIAGFALHGPGTPADDSVAAGLARDMTDHHAQAVDMATIIQARTKDSAIRYLATDIALTQTNQMGQMQGWLNDWSLSLGRSGPPMAWMNTTNHGQGMRMGNSGPAIDPALMRLQSNGLMPGMATAAQIQQLRTLPPADADKLFLKLMIDHHRGGVAMAQSAIDLTSVPVVVALCRTMVADQQNEIVQMTQLLKARS